jgi:hypothetical protein
MDKSAWDESVDGPNPVLADREVHLKELTRQETLLAMSPEERLNYLDGIQAEAISLANSRGAEFMLPEQHFLARWQTNAKVAAASLHTFQDPERTVENREAQIKEQRYALATALYKLGQTENALMMAAPFPELVEHINWIQAAVDLDDELLTTHDCVRPKGETVTHNGKNIETKLNRRSEAEEVFSERHGAVVHVWVCSVCGEANATVEIPERQARDASLHAAIDRDFKAGKSLTYYQSLSAE